MVKPKYSTNRRNVRPCGGVERSLIGRKMRLSKETYDIATKSALGN